jgi:hypothetical protein
MLKGFRHFHPQFPVWQASASSSSLTRDFAAIRSILYIHLMTIASEG